MYCLRELEENDLLQLSQLEYTEEMFRVLGMPYNFAGLNINQDMCRNYILNYNNGIRCVIELKETKLILGIISLTTVDYINRCAKIWIILLNCEMNKNEVEIFALNAILSHAFSKMNLKRIEVFIPKSNKDAQILYKQCGFAYEGIKRMAKCNDQGDFEDIAVYSILKDEYKENEVNDTDIIALPKYCLLKTQNKKEIEEVIEQCDHAFNLPVRSRKYYNTLVEKFNKYAHVVYAYDGRVLGYAAFYANNPEYAYISLIAVRPKFQKLHIGKRILKYCEDISRSYDIPNIRLEVDKDNDIAIRFYTANGYVWFEDKSENSFYMNKYLKK